jgi:hypothetical protein
VCARAGEVRGGFLGDGEDWKKGARQKDSWILEGDGKNGGQGTRSGGREGVGEG